MRTCFFIENLRFMVSPLHRPRASNKSLMIVLMMPILSIQPTPDALVTFR